MAEASLQGVIEQLRREGEATRSSDRYSIRTLQETIQAQTAELVYGLSNIIDVISTSDFFAAGGLRPETYDDEMTSSKQKEEKREETGLLQSIIDSLDGLGKAMTGFADSVLDVMGSAAKGVGLLALGAMLFNPDLALKAFNKAVKVISGAINAINDLSQGSTEGLIEFIKENPIVTAVGSAFLVFKAMSVLGGTLVSLGSMIGSIAAAMLKINAFFGGTATAVTGPMLAAAAGIALVVYSLVRGLMDAYESFKETGSLLEGFKSFFRTFVSTLIGLPLDFIKGVTSMILDFFGLDLVADKLDSFSFQDVFADIIDSYIGLIEDLMHIPKVIYNMLKDGMSNILDIGKKFSNWFSSDDEDATNQSKKSKDSGFLSNWFSSDDEDATNQSKKSKDGGFLSNWFSSDDEESKPNENNGSDSMNPADRLANRRREKLRESSSTTLSTDNQTVEVNTVDGIKTMTQSEIVDGVSAGTITLEAGRNAIERLSTSESSSIVAARNEVQKLQSNSNTDSRNDGVEVNTVDGIKTMTQSEIVDGVSAGTITLEAGRNAIERLSTSESSSIVAARNEVQKLQSNSNTDSRNDGVEVVRRASDSNAITTQSSSSQSIASMLESKPPMSTELRFAQKENNMLTTNSAESAVSALAPVIQAFAAGGGGGKSNQVNNVSNTQIIKKPIADTLSREFTFKPA